MKILIVDDSKAMRLIVRRALREAGYGHHDIIEAGNGMEALEVIRTSSPDVVLSDWNMPEMTGIDLLTTITSASIPVKFGFVTSEGTDEMRERARGAGALFYIVKPFNSDALTAGLGSILDNR